MNRDRAAESVYSRLKRFLLGGLAGIVVTVLVGAIVIGLLSRTTKVTIIKGGGNGVVTFAQCRSLPEGMPYNQVVKLLGWPKRLGNRHGWAQQYTNGTELDYPVTDQSLYFTPLCGIIFGSKYGTVDHKWVDLS